MAARKRIDLSAQIPKHPKDIVVCKVCGAESQLFGDRWIDFMWPHFKGPCGQGREDMHGFFDWRPLKEGEAEMHIKKFGRKS